MPKPPPKLRRLMFKLFDFKIGKDISAFQEVGNMFDLVVLCQSLEHFVSPVSIIKEIRKIVNPKSYIYIEVPNAKWHLSSELFHETMWTKRLLEKFLISQIVIKKCLILI